MNLGCKLYTKQEYENVSLKKIDFFSYDIQKI